MTVVDGRAAGQSSNDSFPTAMHISINKLLHEVTVPGDDVLKHRVHPAPPTQPAEHSAQETAGRMLAKV